MLSLPPLADREPERPRAPRSYSGPTYSKAFEPGVVDLNGSNTWEGTYFVFIDLQAQPAPDAAEPSDDGPFES